MSEDEYGGEITQFIERLLKVVHVNESNAFAMGVVNAISASYAIAMANMAGEVKEEVDKMTVSFCMSTYAEGYMYGRKLCGDAYGDDEERVIN